MDKEHTWYFCNHCEDYIVICKTCGNNSCNAGYGTLEDGSECTDCESAYELMLSKKGMPVERPDFILKFDIFNNTGTIFPQKKFEDLNALKEYFIENKLFNYTIYIDTYLWKNNIHSINKIELDKDIKLIKTNNDFILEDCEHYYNLFNQKTS